MKKKIKACLAVFALLAFLAVSILPYFVKVSANNVASLQQKLEQATAEKKAAQNQLNEIKSNIGDIEAQKQAIDLQLAEVENEVHKIQLEIDDTQARIDQKEAELQVAEQELEEYTDLHKTRIRVMYENSDISYLEIIFGAKDFSDLLYRIELVDQVMAYDKEILTELDNARKKIEDAKQLIEEEKEGLVLNRQIQEEKAAELESTRQAKLSILESLEADEAKYKEILDAADRAEASVRSEIQALTSSGTSTVANPYSGGALLWPAPSTTYITSPYGYRFHPIQKRNKLHTGIDIGAGYGAAVLAAEGGTVLRAGWNGGYGQYIVIDHGNGLSTLYAHNSVLLVSAGQTVSRGQQIAKVGSTGNSTGPHLHFEVLRYGQTEDPMSYFG